MSSPKFLKVYLPNEASLFSVMHQYYDELFRYGVKFTANVEETKDALNEFFIHIWDNRNKLEKVENLKAYLFVSYKRWLITHLRKMQKQCPPLAEGKKPEELYELSYEEVIISQVRDEEIKKLLEEAIASLPRRQRQLLQMRFYENRSFEEISEQTSLSIRTVYNKLHEAVKKLRSNKLMDLLKSKLYY